jgi:hypothetical protein
VPSIVVKANDYASFVDYSLVVVAEGKEHKPLLVSIVVLVDTSYM